MPTYISFKHRPCEIFEKNNALLAVYIIIVSLFLCNHCIISYFCMLNYCFVADAMENIIFITPPPSLLSDFFQNKDGVGVFYLLIFS